MKILHIEDDSRDAELVRTLLEAEWPGCEITLVQTAAAFRAALARDYDLVLSDFSIPGFNGVEALKAIHEHAPDVPFIFLSGTIGEDRAIETMHAGARDYVLKDRLERLVPAIARALRESEEHRLRELAERRLRELADIIDRANEAIIVCDLGGRVIQWNRGAEKSYGVPTTDALGRTAEQLFPDSLLAKLHAAREQTLATGEWDGEIALFARDGREIVADVHMTLIRDDAGQPKARLIIASDVTEKRKIEEQFLRAQRLESIGMLAAGIAHDLNNVLAPVLMAAPLLRVRASDPRDLRMLEALEKSAERGASLVRQILGFAHGVAGGFRLTPVNHLIRDIVEVIQASFPKSIQLEEYIPGDLWPVQANATQIHQVILNLAVNARDALLPRGGTLALRAENQLLDESAARAYEAAQPGLVVRRGRFVVVSVADTGTGIPPEVLARIWEPFFTTKGEGKGTGLGLCTVRGIVATHSGFVTIDTRVGRGTTFRVYLPAAETAALESAPDATAVMPRGQGELILVVDDDQAIRDTAAAILTHQGFRVATAADGVEAIGLFTQHREEVRLVVTDLNMPHVDGTVLALVLRRLQPGVKILAITGLGSKETAPVEEFALAKLQKPFSAEALLRTVHQLAVRAA